ncbi:MAG: OmpA family protein [Akkermansia sp.]
MNRTLLVSLVSFLLTLGIGGGMVYLLEHRPQPTPAPAPSASEQPAAAEPAPEALAPEQSAPAAGTATQPETSTAPAEPMPEPTPTPEPAPATESAPSPEPTAQPAPEPLRLAEVPRSAEHAAALTATAALSTQDPRAALARLVATGEVSEQAAAVIADWGSRHQVARVEEVGNSRRDNGERVTRYRVVATEGGEDLLLDVVTRADGSTFVESAKTTSADKTALTSACDALTVAEGFVEAVRSGDMAKARSMTVGRQVSDATIAGLCMIFEEGEFRLRDNAPPIRNAFENETNAGFIVYLLSAASQQTANIGLEEARSEQGWGVSAVSLDELLSLYESSANAEGGHYFPIVKNPKGGDSLALFFAFDEAALTPRSLRQLQIVAELLKQSSGQLNISGHTDDVGSEAYNQKLSERRAEAVKAALVSFGVQAEQINTSGMGKSQPRRTFAQDVSEEELNFIRGENRRAEIYLDFE